MHPLGSSRTHNSFCFYLHDQYPQTPLTMIVHPCMLPPPPPSSTGTNSGSSMPLSGGISPSGLISTSEAPSNNSGSMVANPFHLSHLIGTQAGSFTGQQGLSAPPVLPMAMHNNLGSGTSPNYSPAGASSTYNSGALNSSLEALLQQVTPPSDENQVRRDQLLLQLLLEKHDALDSKQSGGAGNN